MELTFLSPTALGWGSVTINAAQARELVGEGNEIGNHTRDHKDLAKLTAAQVTAEFADAQRAIESQVGVRPSTCADPRGEHAAVVAEAAKQFDGCRSTEGGFNERGHLDTYNLLSYYVQRDTTAAEMGEAAEEARRSNTWVVFVYHGVIPVPQGPDDVTQSLRRSYKCHRVNRNTRPDNGVALAAMSR